MGNPKFILSGGGTGGHIYPAVAIADELKSRFPDAEFLFVGASDKMEMQKVPQAGYKIIGLWIAGLQRKLTLRNAMFPLKLLSSLWKSRRILKEFKPDVVIGTGGFASGPLLQAAVSAGIPTLIQEQNSYPGITNKLLGRKADRICVAYTNLERFFPVSKMVLTGNPVRQDLMELAGKKIEALEHFGLDPQRKVLLVLGGSLGARTINELVAANLALFADNGMQVLWQCGKLYWERYEQHHGGNVRVLPFIEKMDLAYAAADVVISRAGASSVSELCLVGKPVIFIPSPNVAEDHQAKNAKAITDAGGAIMLREAELESGFAGTFTNLVNDGGKMARLAENIGKLASPEATRKIADEVEKLIKK